MKTINEILKNCESKSGIKRRNAVRNLGRLGEKAATPEVVQALIKLCEDQNSDRIQIKAMFALRRLGEEAIQLIL